MTGMTLRKKVPMARKTDLVDVENKYDGPLDYIDLYQVILAFCCTAEFL